MKYSSTQISNMSYSEWMATIAKELNAAGYKSKGYIEDGQGRMAPGYVPYEVYDVGTFFEGAINDGSAVDYLKSIGLINNSRCPVCGSQIKGRPSLYTYSLNPRINYHICSSCRREGQRLSINSKSSGCIVALLLIPWHIIKYLIHFN